MRIARSGAAGLATALRLLTVLPIPASGEDDTPPPGSVASFPLVGLVVGAPLAACALAPLPSSARAALILAGWTVITGGLHEDGWADTMDAALAPVRRGDRVRILKDPRVGAHGLTATVLLLLLRFGALTAVPATALLVAPIVGRWAMAVSLATAPPLRETGLGARYGEGASATAPTLAALVLLLAIALFAARPLRVLVAWSAGAVTAWLLGRTLTRRLGGLNGDGHGAVGVAAETVALWALLPLT